MIELRPKTIDRPPEFVSIEVKLSQKWKAEFEGSSRALKVYAKNRLKKMIGIYLGADRLVRDGFEIYPLADFIRELFDGKIL